MRSLSAEVCSSLSLRHLSVRPRHFGDPADSDYVFAGGEQLWRCRTCAASPIWSQVHSGDMGNRSQGQEMVAFGSAHSVELLLRYIQLSKNLEEQRRTNFTPAVQRNCHGPSVAVRPAFVAARLATLHETERHRRPLKLARRRASS